MHRIEAFSQVLWRQRILFCAVLLVGVIVFAWAATTNRRYTASSTILAVTGSSSDSAVLDPQRDPQSAAIGPQDLPNLLRSSTVLNRIAADIHLTAPEAAKLGGELKAKGSIGSNVMPITATTANPKNAVAAANAAARELQRFEREIATSRYNLLVSDLNNQLASRRDALHIIDQKIDLISTSDPYVTADTGTNGINQRLVALLAQRDQIHATMLGDQAAAAMAGQRPGLARDLAGREIIQNDPVFQNLRQQYGKDLAQLTQAKASYTDQAPGMAGMQDHVKREGTSVAHQEAQATASPNKSPTYVATLLDANKANAALANDKSMLAAVDSQVAAQTAHLSSSRDAAVRIAGLRRERDAGDQAYAQLANRLARALADRSQAASINSIVILDDAIAAQPALFSRPPVLAVAIGLVFLWLAITLAHIADAADSRLRTRATIEELYGSPVITNVG